MNRRTYGRIAILLGLFLFCGSRTFPEGLPSRITDEEFWKIITDFSEKDGNFNSDNFVSNERAYQHVLPDLKKRVAPGGVYLGVGPEQNFTYISAVRPRIAFIFDIRRQNMIELLMYKALFELSSDRRDFLSLLFSRRLPSPVRAGSVDLESLLDAVKAAPSDAAMYASTLRAIRQNLTETHGFQLTTVDQSRLERIFNAFFMNGLELNYIGRSTNLYPTYLELLLETGPNQITENYLSSEDNFQFVQEMQKDNRIIPLVGDFAGSGALRAVGDYLREHDAAVSTFYTSNVEQYLFADPVNWKHFYRNVGSFPIENSAVVIRALIQNEKGVYSNLPLVRTGYRMETMLFSMPDLAVAFDTGGIRDYANILRTGNLSAQGGTALPVELANPNPSNVGVLVRPKPEPPAHLTATALSPSEIVLNWPRMEQGDITGFKISRQTAGSWGPLVHSDFNSLCSSDPCKFEDSNLKADVRYCYRIQSADDYSNPGAKQNSSEDFGEPSITVCATPASQTKQ
jgi:hypothetical protein